MLANSVQDSRDALRLREGEVEGKNAKVMYFVQGSCIVFRTMNGFGHLDAVGIAGVSFSGLNSICKIHEKSLIQPYHTRRLSSEVHLFQFSQERYTSRNATAPGPWGPISSHGQDLLPHVVETDSDPSAHPPAPRKWATLPHAACRASVGKN